MDNVFKCCICGAIVTGYGNNPYPVVKAEGARCCDDCNWLKVIPARLEAFANKGKEEADGTV